MVRTIDDVYSRYVHGASSTIMELYEGGGNEGFRVSGTLGSPHIAVYRGELARYAHRSLNVFASIAHGLALGDLAQRLVETRRSLEASSAYQS